MCVRSVRCRLPLLRVAAGFRRGHSPPARGEAQFLRAEQEEYHDRLVPRYDEVLCLLLTAQLDTATFLSYFCHDSSLHNLTEF